MYSAVVAKVDVSVSVHTAEYNIQQGWGFPPVMAFLHRADLGTVMSVSTSTNNGSPRARVTGHRSGILKYYSFAGPMRGKPTGGFPIPVHAITALSLHRSCTRHKCLIPL